MKFKSGDRVVFEGIAGAIFKGQVIGPSTIMSSSWFEIFWDDSRTSSSAHENVLTLEEVYDSPLNKALK